MYNFEVKIASRGYHVYKETTWMNASVDDRVNGDIETNPTSLNIDPYSCAIKNNGNIVGHIPREISRHVYFFIRDMVGMVRGHVLSTVYRPSPIPAGGWKYLFC